MTVKRLLIAAALAASLGSAHANVSGLYKPRVDLSITECRLFFVMGDAEKFSTCLGEKEVQFKTLYDQAVKAAGKKASLKTALKGFHVRALHSLRGILPASNERRLAYDIRQAELQTQVDQAWTIVEVEQ